MRNPARLAPMTHRLRSLALGLAPALLLVACTAAPAGPGSSGSPAASGSDSSVVASPSAAPSDTPGAVGGNPGITPVPVPGGPSASGGAVPAPSPTEVQPVANLLNVHDIRAEAFTVDGSSGTIKVTIVWWSGPPPCSQLSDAAVARSDTPTGTSFTLTVREGAEQVGVACPALAVHKQTRVDLGPIRDQDWTVAVVGVNQPQSIHMGGQP